MNTARTAAMPRITQRTTAIALTPRGGGSSPSGIGSSWTFGDSADMRAPVFEVLRIEGTERPSGDCDADGGVEIGERVVERGAGRDDLALDVDDGSTRRQESEDVRPRRLVTGPRHLE